MRMQNRKGEEVCESNIAPDKIGSCSDTRQRAGEIRASRDYISKVCARAFAR